MKTFSLTIINETVLWDNPCLIILVYLVLDISNNVLFRWTRHYIPLRERNTRKRKSLTEASMLSRYLINMERTLAVMLCDWVPWSSQWYAMTTYSQTGKEKGREKLHYWCSQTLRFPGLKMIQHYHFLCLSGSIVPHTLNPITWYLDVIWLFGVLVDFTYLSPVPLLTAPISPFFWLIWISLALPSVSRASHFPLYHLFSSAIELSAFIDNEGNK